MKVPVVKLDPDLPTPQRAHPGDAGIDLHARTSVTLEPGEWAMIPTGIAVAIPDGHVGFVAARSGLAARSAISVVNGPGVVDAGFRGEIHAILINHGADVVLLDRGDRIAQLVVVPVPAVDFEPVEQLPDSKRGPAGFGSSGR